MSQRERFFGAFDEKEPCVQLRCPYGLRIGMNGQVFEIEVHGGYRLRSLLEGWTISNRKSLLHVMEADLSLTVTRHHGCGQAYPDRFEVVLKTDEFSAEIRFQPYADGAGLSGIYSVIR